jgi:hypothetical protein
MPLAGWIAQCLYNQEIVHRKVRLYLIKPFVDKKYTNNIILD